jgi:photosystem II stability/assembly factor-like uncharacterized protein
MKDSRIAFFLLLTVVAGGCVNVGRISNPDFTLKARSLSFVGSATAWIITQSYDVFRTKNGGDTWDRIDIDKSVKSEQIFFVDENYGWVVDRVGKIRKTDDGGQHWLVISTLDGQSGLLTIPPTQIFFADKNHGWIVSPISLWKTINGGEEWHRYDYGSDLPQVVKATKCDFVDSRYGWIVGVNGMSFRTRDGGQTWERVPVASDDEVFDSIAFVNERVGWVNGWPKSGVYKTEDGGKTWHQQLPQIFKKRIIKYVYFLDQDNGWAVGTGLGDVKSADSQVASRGIVLQTRDGGKSWKHMELKLEDAFFGYIHFADMIHGWLFASSNVYRTDDGGLSWRLIFKL